MKLSKIKNLIENSLKQLNEQQSTQNMQPGQQITITCPGGFDTALTNAQGGVTTPASSQMVGFMGATQVTLGCSGLNTNSPGGPNFIPKVPKRR